MAAKFTLKDFLVESNKIEGIVRPPDILDDEETVAMIFLGRETIAVDDLENVVDTFAGPEAKLRRKFGMDVRVGSHVPCPGGPNVLTRLKELLNHANRLESDAAAHWVHLQYENLHPFMDGNGRSGRLLWLWRMGGIEKAPLGFLHTFYYQTLDASDGR